MPRTRRFPVVAIVAVCGVLALIGIGAVLLVVLRSDPAPTALPSLSPEVKAAGERAVPLFRAVPECDADCQAVFSDDEVAVLAVGTCTLLESGSDFGAAFAELQSSATTQAQGQATALVMLAAVSGTCQQHEAAALAWVKSQQSGSSAVPSPSASLSP